MGISVNEAEGADAAAIDTAVEVTLRKKNQKNIFASITEKSHRVDNFCMK